MSSKSMSDAVKAIFQDANIKRREIVGQSVEDDESDYCEHDWHFVDDSFGHEFGTEVSRYMRCKRCGDTRDMVDDDAPDTRDGEYEFPARNTCKF